MSKTPLFTRVSGPSFKLVILQKTCCKQWHLLPFNHFQLSFEKQKTPVLAVPRQYMLSWTTWSNPGKNLYFSAIVYCPLKIWQDLAERQNVPKMQINSKIFILALSPHTLWLKKWKKTKRSEMPSIAGFLTYHRFVCIYLLHIAANEGIPPSWSWPC